MFERRAIGVSELFSLTFDLLGKQRGNAAIVFSMFLVSEGTMSLILALDEAETVWETGAFTVGASSFGLYAFLIYVAIFAMIVVFSVRLVLSDQTGVEMQPGALAIPQMVKAVAVWLISFVFITFGFIALIIPGVILSARWFAVVPFALQPGTSIASSFGRSNALAQGSTTAIATCLFVIYLPVMLIELFDIEVGGLGEIQSYVRIAFEAGTASMAAVVALFLSLAFYLDAQDRSEELSQVFE